jgi:hypothetical protein
MSLNNTEKGDASNRQPESLHDLREANLEAVPNITVPLAAKDILKKGDLARVNSEISPTERQNS